MKSVNFPLLRTSPAAGFGSYGALPTGFHSSGSSSDSVSDDAEEEQEDALHVLASAGSGPKRRKNARTGKIKDLDPTSSDIYMSEDEEEDEELPEATLEFEEDSEDENDPADNSPYPEVRASVLATDDETLSINTPRMWTLSLLFTLVGSSTNLFFSLRYPSISITPVIALLLAHPLGKLWDQAFPQSLDEEDNAIEKSNGMFARSRRWLGQGRWNRKEHACVYISSNVSFGFAFATDVRLSLFLIGKFSVACDYLGDGVAHRHLADGGFRFTPP